MKKFLRWEVFCALVLIGAVSFSSAYGGAPIVITGPGMALASELCERHVGVLHLSVNRRSNESEIKCGDGLVVFTNLNLARDNVYPKN